MILSWNTLLIYMQARCPDGETSKVNLALGRKHYSGAIVLKEKKIPFFLPPVSFWLQLLCTVEEPRVPTLEVTLMASCWLLQVSLCSDIEPPGFRLKGKKKLVEHYLLPLTFCSSRRFGTDCCFLTGSRKPILVCQRDPQTPPGSVPSGAFTSASIAWREFTGFCI